MFILTDEQQKIIEKCRELQPGESLKIDACAGSGKTASLVEIARAIPQARFLYLAFNKAIVENAKTRFPPNVTIRTTHSLAYSQIISGSREKFTVKAGLNIFDLEPIFKIRRDLYKDLSLAIRKFYSWCQSDVRVFPDSSTEKIFQAMESHLIPATHDWYLKKYQLLDYHYELDAFDFILLDEAQDTNLVTLDIFNRNHCRKILVGDTHQGIYGFRGAYNALERFKSDYKLHLSYTFRSVQPICEKANWFLSSFARDKKDLVPMKSAYFSELSPNPRNAVLTRTNATLIDYLQKLNREQIPRSSLLRDPYLIFGAALNIQNFIKGDPLDKDYQFLERFDSLENIKDYAHDSNDLELEMAIKMAEKYKEHLFNLYELAKSIYLNSNERANIFLTTAHSAKGLEWDQVVLASDFCPLFTLKKDLKEKGLKKQEIEFEFTQELNLYYVAMTRAKNTLIDRTPNEAFYEKSLKKDLKKAQKKEEKEKQNTKALAEDNLDAKIGSTDDALLKKALSEVENSAAEIKETVIDTEVKDKSSNGSAKSRKKRASAGTPGKTIKKRKRKTTRESEKE
ncbi:Superfamily I DNA or RNA helicase [Succinivibrio dextrinosolvens]|uniref:UvrD-helicase domain-containing protein n=1 Tax=Succinivibrio dextrinosolvens TaxID=83771 RepID=UPI0008E8E837|nr:UvrD-helicase domain-containing protein [Succinivibrio dextrinosolvens]SFS34159.1 Superfamily I DNA or RNA helicase [Succinivibrio dextrinosolvens]